MLRAEAKPVWWRLLHWHSIVLHHKLIQYLGPFITCIRIFIAFVGELVAGLAKVLVVIFTIHLSISLTKFAGREIRSSPSILDIDAAPDDVSQDHIVCMVQDILHLKGSLRLILIGVLNIDRVVTFLQWYTLDIFTWHHLVAVGLANTSPEHAEGVLGVFAEVICILNDRPKGELLGLILRDIQSTSELCEGFKVPDIRLVDHLYSLDLCTIPKPLSSSCRPRVNLVDLHVLETAIHQP